MTEQTQKIRLYKLAKELNLSHDTLIDFLVRKGFEIKNHMSIVDAEMLEAVERHYKKEKVEAERHARKRKEYDEQDRKRRGEKEPAKEEAEAPAKIEKAVEPEPVPEPAPEVAAPAEVEVAAAEETAAEAPVVEPEAPEEIPAPEPEVPVTPEEPAVIEVESVVEAPAPVEPEAEAEAEIVVVEAEAPAEPARPPRKKAEAKPEPKPKPELDVSLEASMPRMGLTVKGKIDLTPKVDALASKDKGAGADEKPKTKHKKKKKLPTTKTETTDDKSAAKTPARKGRKVRGREVDAEEVKTAIKRTIASMGDYGPVSQRSAIRKRKRARREEEQKRETERIEQEQRILRIHEYATVSEIAALMNVSVAEIITSLIGLGVMASINQRLDLDTITLVASEFEFEVQAIEATEDEIFEDKPEEDENLVSRPPIVTIMGHVDHGKTSLLDHIRSSNVVAGESGGITQHIGAYTVTLDNGRRITFLDTPGHEAFTAMRARGAQVTDIVVLVVAADDSVMPQTVEAISHAQAAKVPIVVAINKIDRPDANIDRIKQQLAERNVLIEEYGGRYGAVPISAKKGINIDQLLDRILLEADILDLKANPEREARGVIIESQMDKKGIVATVLVQKGTLHVGDAFVAGNEFGKVRALNDERGKRVVDAPPSTPVRVMGFNGLPQAGDPFVVVESDREAREIAGERQLIRRESDFRSQRRKTLDDISEQIAIGGVKELSLIVKADVDGSMEALTDSLQRLSTDEVQVRVIHSGVGAISESDVLLASASNAFIIGFHVRPNMNARKLAEAEEIEIRLYEIIYDAIEDVKKALEGLLTPDISEKVTSSVLVRETFKISRLGTIAGCYVQDGKITRNSRIRLLRDGIVVFTGGISSLKRFKDDVREVDTGFECGIGLDGFNDIKVGDIIESFEQVETKRTLS